MMDILLNKYIYIYVYIYIYIYIYIKKNEYCRVFNKTERAAKRAYYAEMLEARKHNIKETWTSNTLKNSLSFLKPAS